MTGKNGKRKKEMTIPSSAKEDKRELILLAANEVFGKKGFHDATVEEIAKTAGVGKGTIYQYFSSKKQIIEELHGWYAQRYRRLLDEKWLPERTFTENIAELIDEHIDNMVSAAGLMRQMLKNPLPEMEVCDQNQSAEMDQMLAAMVALYQAAAEKGEVRAMDAAIAVSCIMGIFVGPVHVLLTCSGNLDPALLKQEILGIFQRAFVVDTGEN